MSNTVRGHEIEWNEKRDEWVYSDTRAPVKEEFDLRPCGHCGLGLTPEGHDPCLGTLPEVKNACCGHGDTEQAFVQFWGGRRLSGVVATLYLELAVHCKTSPYWRYTSEI